MLPPRTCLAALIGVCVWSPTAGHAGSEPAGGTAGVFKASSVPERMVWGRCLSHRLLLGHGHWPQGGCGGGARSGSAAHTRAAQEQPRSLAPRLCTPARWLLCLRSDGRWRGRGAPTWHWRLGFQQPLSTWLFEACVGVPEHPEHPLTPCITLSLSLQLPAGGEE